MSADDIAVVAAAALTAPEPPNRDLLVLGPEPPLSYADVAATLTRALGRAIAHRDLGEAELVRRRRDVGGMPEQHAAVLAAMDTAIRNGSEEHFSRDNDVPGATGRPPRSFADFVEKNRDVWAPAEKS